MKRCRKATFKKRYIKMDLYSWKKMDDVKFIKKYTKRQKYDIYNKYENKKD